jgi:hypothetical protein
MIILPAAKFVHLGERRLLGRFSGRGQRLFDVAEAALELFVGGAQRGFRVGAEMAGQVDDGKQEIADLLPGRARRAGRELGGDFTGLLADFCQHRQGIVPVETNPAGLFLELERTRQGGEGDRNTRKRARAAFAGAVRSNRAARCPLAFLLRLDLIPQCIDRIGIETPDIAEHVGMAPHQLFGDGLHHVAEPE